MHPGHYWLCQFGIVGNRIFARTGSRYRLASDRINDYEGTRFYNGALHKWRACTCDRAVVEPCG